jgi:hypothetical protein
MKLKKSASNDFLNEIIEIVNKKSVITDIKKTANYYKGFHF